MENPQQPPTNIPGDISKQSNPLGPVPSEEMEIKKPKKLKLVNSIGLIILVFGIVLSLVYFIYPNLGENKNTPSKKIDNKVADTQSTDKRWANCADIRKVIKENNLLYVSCLGGVLIVDNKGTVIDQITMAEGLGNPIATDLVKLGDKLYIGTQDGFSVYDLKTKTAKKVSVSEGLVNGSNIVLALDGTNLWVGTFQGISIYNTNTESFIEHPAEFASLGKTVNVSDLINTPNAVYALIIANSGSSGGVGRYDKLTKTWKIYTPADLGETGPYERLDAFSGVYSGGKIYINEQQKVWEFEDKADSTWVRLTKLEETLKGDNKSPINIKPYADFNGKLILTATTDQGKMTIYSYDPSFDTVTDFEKGTAFENILARSQAINGDNKNLWVYYLAGLSFQNTGAWIGEIDLTGKTLNSIKLSGRPVLFSKILNSINNSVYVLGLDGSVWSESDNQFVKVDGVEMDGGTQEIYTLFQPVIGSDKIFIYEQICGMGCEEPKFRIYNFTSKKTSDLKVPDNIKSLYTQEPNGPIKSVGYFNVLYKSYDESRNVTEFGLPDKKKIISYDANSDSWSEKDAEEVDIVKIEQEKKYLCDQDYIFSKGKFARANNCQNAQNDDYIWTIKDSAVIQTAKKDGQVTSINYPAGPTPYSPFENWTTNKEIRRLLFADSYLWIGTNLGLVRYNPKDSTTKLILAKDGMVSDQVSDLLIKNNELWVLNDGYGVSRIVLK